jgi:hypothetical protein
MLVSNGDQSLGSVGLGGGGGAPLGRSFPSWLHGVAELININRRRIIITRKWYRSAPYAFLSKSLRSIDWALRRFYGSS